jgi:hypothetical protein
VGPLSRIRHSFSPAISWSYEPAANVPEEYARAVAGPGQEVVLRSDASQRVSVGLNQTFEGKRRPPQGDTASVDDAKLRLLSISTSALTYDFEQAKRPGRTGWATDQVTNSLLSDLVPGFNLSLTHDLWDGEVGTDAARFDGRMLRDVVTNDNTASDVWADTAYRSQANEKWLKAQGRVSRIHRKKPRGKPMPERTAKANATKSRVRARVEHVFAQQKDKMGLFIRTIGIKRAEAKITLANLAYNMHRLIFHERRAATG